MGRLDPECERKHPSSCFSPIIENGLRFDRPGALELRSHQGCGIGRSWDGRAGLDFMCDASHVTALPTCGSRSTLVYSYYISQLSTMIETRIRLLSFRSPPVPEFPGKCASLMMSTWTPTLLVPMLYLSASTLPLLCTSQTIWHLYPRPSCQCKDALRVGSHGVPFLSF